MNLNLSDSGDASDEIELPLERFGVRSQTVLRQLNIAKVSEFLGVDWQNVECWQLGAGTRQQLRQIHEEMSRDVEAWLRQSRAGSTSIAVDWPDDIASVPLPVESLSVRARGVLQQNEVTTLGAFLNFHWEGAFARQLGAKTRAEILAWRAEMGQTPDAVRDWMKTQKNGAQSAASLRYLPLESQLLETEGGQIDYPRLWPRLVRETLGGESRAYEVLKRRFGLEGSAIYKQEDLGLILGVTRQRVQEIEKVARLRLRDWLSGQAPRGSKLQLHPRVLEEHGEFKQWIEAIGFPLAEDELWELLAQRYGTPLGPDEKAALRLLLELCDFEDVCPAPPDVPQKLGRIWLQSAQDRSFVSAVLRATAQNLRERVEPISLFDLQIAVNRALKQGKIERGCDEVALGRLIALWPRAEEIAPGWFQTRWEFLPSNQTRAERILREWAAQGTLRATIAELCREINHRHALAGRDEGATAGVVSTACAASPHIATIGKSGWSLTENAGETRPVHEIIKEALLKLNREATIEELTDYVAERRQTAPLTVACLMNQHAQFQRVGRGVYALRAWGMADAPPVRRGEEYQREFDDFLVEIFLENDLQPLPQATLASQLQTRLGWPIGTIRQRIERSPSVETTSINGFHLMAHLRDQPEAEEKPARATKTHRVQEAARALLQQAPQREMKAATLVALIETQTHFVKPLIYTALAAMPDVKRRVEAGSMVYLLEK